MKRGKFLVFEGGEGTGKSTVCRELAKRVGGYLTREPGGTPFAEHVRQEILLGQYRTKMSPLTQFGMMCDARVDHLVSINEQLEAGTDVICDRFDASTFVYQIRGSGLDDLTGWFFRRRAEYLKWCEPDLYLIFDLDPNIGQERMRSRNEALTIFDEKPMDFHHRVRRAYREFADICDSRCVIVDASRPLKVVIESVFKIYETL